MKYSSKYIPCLTGCFPLRKVPRSMKEETMNFRRIPTFCTRVFSSGKCMCSSFEHIFSSSPKGEFKIFFNLFNQLKFLHLYISLSQGQFWYNEIQSICWLIKLFFTFIYFGGGEWAPGHVLGCQRKTYESDHSSTKWIFGNKVWSSSLVADSFIG